MSELLNCPFCGSADRKNHEQHCFFKVYDASNCYCSPVTMDEMGKAWNQREDGWVSVDYDMPEMDFSVLVCIGDSVSETTYRVSENGDQYFDIELISKGRVTHWQPMPQPPTTSTLPAPST